VDDQEDLYRNWLEWVTTNLGRDHRLASVAATAAADAAGLGKGFNVAVGAAKAAWNEAAKTGATTADRTAAAAGPAKWERLAFFAWISLTAAWLWPIVTVVLSKAWDLQPGTKIFVWDSLDVWQFSNTMAFPGVVAIPAFALIAIALGHSARANIRGTDRRGGSVATVALILSYITLIGSPIWIIGFFIAAVGIAWCGC
jgi:hypothetical protein